METPSQVRDLLAEIETICSSNQSLQLELTQKDQLLHQIQLQKDDALNQCSEAMKERDTLIQRLKDDFHKETERIRMELEVSRKKVEELLHEKKEQSQVCSHNLEIIESAKNGLVRLVENLDLNVHGSGEYSELKRQKQTKLLNQKSAVFSVVLELVNLVEEKWGEYKEMREKEKRELEKSVMSLEEENRDTHSLLKIALVEKEVAERSLNRLRSNNEQKKAAAILQIAGRGLQKVGFGFIMGSATSEIPSDNLDSDTNFKSEKDGSQTEAVTLVMPYSFHPCRGRI